jgi:hypothetical protein
MLHAVFHRALVRPAGFVDATAHQGFLAPGVHAQRDLVVFDAGFHVGGLLGLDELAFEGRDFFGIVELDHVECFLRPMGCSVDTVSTCGYHSTMMCG